MRELHGIAFVGTALDELKHKALLFDHFHVWNPGHAIINNPDLDFLRANGLIADVRFDLASLANSSIAHNATMEMVFVSTLIGTDEHFDLKRWPPLPPEMINNELADCVTWAIARTAITNDNMTVVPICERPTPEIVMAYRGLGNFGDRGCRWTWGCARRLSGSRPGLFMARRSRLQSRTKGQALGFPPFFAYAFYKATDRSRNS